MPRKRLPIAQTRLFRLAEATVRALSLQHEGLRLEEALLRAAIAWAKYTRDAHIAAVESAKDSSNATLVETARQRSIRAHWRLRLRLAEVIARKGPLPKDDRLLKLAKLALSA